MRADLRALVFTLVALFYVAAGTYKASHFSTDMIPVYAGASCILHGCNPYAPPQLVEQYLAAKGNPKFVGPGHGLTAVYPPSTLLALSPLAFFHYRAASVIWALLGGSALVVATGMVLWATAKDPSWVPTVLASIILLLGDGLLGMGNPATFACALAVIGTMLFLIGRYVPLGAVLLTLSLAVKPQVAGLIIVYLLVRGVGRRWAALSLAGGFAFLMAGILVLEMHPASRNWLPSLRANLAECVMPGRVNDPTPANPQVGLTNLQTLTSVFLANPRAWSAVALGIALVLFVLWVAVVRKLESGVPNHFLALPPLLVWSLFPVYHRSCDALILLLSFPMIVTVLRGRKVLGACIAVLTALPFLSDAFIFPIHRIIGRFWNLQALLSHKLLFILLMRPWSLELLALFVLYLVAMRRLPAGDRLGSAQLQPAISA